MKRRPFTTSKTFLPAAYAALLAAVSLFSSCRPLIPVETKDFIMGTVVSQKVYGPDAKAAAVSAVQRMRQLEAQLSFFNPSSEISRLNASAGITPVRLSSETLFLLRKSSFYAKESGGAFDILVGPLVRKWKVTQGGTVPSKEEIAALLPLADWKGLRVSENGDSAMLEKKGQMADLGGIAKGFAADEVLRIYRAHAITSAVIDIGGNVSVLGKNPDGNPWRVGIQNPLAERGITAGYVEIEDRSMSTSGAYERFFKSGGKQYHHIIDPSTGYPSDSDLTSTTIIAASSTDTDALSTAAFVLGCEKGMRLVGQIKEASAVFITKDRTIHATKDLHHTLTVTDGFPIIWH